MSDIEFDPNVKGRILDVLADLNDVELESIETWFCSRAYKKELEQKRSLDASNEILKKIGDTIKDLVPFEAEMASETIAPPTIGEQADCNAINTLHVDEFLYDEDEVAELAKKGKIKRHYCLDCSSRNIKDLTFISHSMSKEELLYIFKVLLPKDLEDKQLLDVGSRLGTVLFGAYYLSNLRSIIGIEMNKELCKVQEKVIEQFSMDNNRIKVIHSDVMNKGDIVANSNIVVINILDFFVDNQKHRDMWYFFKKHMKKGSYLVTNRSMRDTLDDLEIYHDFANWLNICRINQMENEIFCHVEDYSNLYLYIIN
ncbi:uncharacterized protein LOC115442207 [Manduca sexta]|uniref:uncharacterized protein LOC115442207 n=1 Tax=Manduca sexta TaxID=7130 RepID=UPI00188F2897|nr:uncharacterized protein LOC115442207 [Manduca sexta]